MKVVLSHIHICITLIILGVTGALLSCNDMFDFMTNSHRTECANSLIFTLQAAVPTTPSPSPTGLALPILTKLHLTKTNLLLNPQLTVELILVGSLSELYHCCSTGCHWSGIHVTGMDEVTGVLISTCNVC